jgi:hypothetical protein
MMLNARRSHVAQIRDTIFCALRESFAAFAVKSFLRGFPISRAFFARGDLDRVGRTLLSVAVDLDFELVC